MIVHHELRKRALYFMQFLRMCSGFFGEEVASKDSVSLQVGVKFLFGQLPNFMLGTAGEI